MEYSWAVEKVYWKAALTVVDLDDYLAALTGSKSVVAMAVCWVDKMEMMRAALKAETMV